MPTVPAYDRAVERADILYLDDDVVAVAKPAGLFVHRTSLGPDRDVLLTRVRDAIGRAVHPVHRLDRPTSGVVLFGLSPEAARGLHEALHAETTHKLYLGLARGTCPDRIVIDRPLTHLESGAAQPARTEVRRIAGVAGASLVLARPFTGRRHQIRRHLGGMAHHLLGDVRYGKGRINRLFRERFGLARLALHALSIEIPHPTRPGTLRITAPIPEDLLGPLRAMPGFDGSALQAVAPGAAGPREAHPHGWETPAAAHGGREGTAPMAPWRGTCTLPGEAVASCREPGVITTPSWHPRAGERNE